MDKPTKITVPNFVDTGQAIYIKWTSVTGQGVIFTYQLERSIDGDNFVAIHSGTDLNYTDIALKGWNDVKYRVCAISAGIKSGYTSSTNVACVYFKIDDNGKLQPFNLIVNFKESKIDVIPNIRETNETIQGVDGEINCDTKYEPRLFDLVCYSPSNKSLEVWQRDNLMSAIGRGFHAIKNTARYLIYRNKLYKVKNGKKPDFDISPSWFKAQLTFKAFNSYGYSFENEVKGNCTFTVDGEEFSPPSIFIEGITNYPIFIINGISYQLKTSTLETDVVEINCENGTVIKNGINNLQYWQSDFPYLKIGTNTISIPANCKLVWRNKYVAV